MTNNINRAAEVIERTKWEHRAKILRDGGTLTDATAEDFARRLADAGLLAPDKPEPHTFPGGEMEWSTLDGWVNLDNGTITMVYDERDEDDIAAGAEIEPGELAFTRLSEARYLALALLAAVDYAESENRHAQDD